MRTKHLDKLLAQPTTPYWINEVSRRLNRVDFVDAVNGLDELLEAMSADLKAYQLERAKKSELFADPAMSEFFFRDNE